VRRSAVRVCSVCLSAWAFCSTTTACGASWQAWRDAPFLRSSLEEGVLHWAGGQALMRGSCCGASLLSCWCVYCYGTLGRFLWAVQTTCSCQWLITAQTTPWSLLCDCIGGLLRDGISQDQFPCRLLPKAGLLCGGQATCCDYHLRAIQTFLP
jgi:hypothetical protein